MRCAQFSLVKTSTVQYSPVEPSTAHHSPVQPSTVQCSPVQPTTTQYSPKQPSTSKLSPVEPGSVHYSLVQPITAQYSPLQPSTIHYSPTQPITAKQSQVQPNTVHYIPEQLSTAHYRQVQPSTGQYSTVKSTTAHHHQCRWKYTTIYTSLHCPDSLLHRSTLVLSHFIVFFLLTCLWYLCRASWWRFLKVSSHWSHMPFSGLSSCSNFMWLFRWYLCEKDFSHNTQGKFLLLCKSALSFGVHSFWHYSFMRG